MVQRYFERRRARADADESGSLILDILIGMAIFALIAIIAVSAIGQYRARAYVQTAVSDAEQVGLALNAAMTDFVQDEGFEGLPEGNVTSDMLAEIGVTVTRSGSEETLISVMSYGAEHFDVCAEHRGAVAVYDSEQGLVESGTVAEVGYGCDFDAAPPSEEDCDPDASGWMEASGPIEGYDVPIGVEYWTGDPDSTTLPWDAGIDRDAFEAIIVDSVNPFVRPYAADMSWWPTTPGEQARFSLVESDGRDVLARDGEALLIVIENEGNEAYCIDL